MTALLTADVVRILHQAIFGGMAAAGFGVLFNFSLRTLPLCALGGALALAIRTIGLQNGWSLEGATFAAALLVSLSASLLRGPWRLSANALALAGCIPMVPGAFFGQALLAFFELTAPHPQNAEQTIVLAVEYTLRVLFTVGAIGAGLTIPMHILPDRDF